jgi:hypothetical protein
MTLSRNPFTLQKCERTHAFTWGWNWHSPSRHLFVRLIALAELAKVTYIRRKKLAAIKCVPTICANLLPMYKGRLCR